MTGCQCLPGPSWSGPWRQRSFQPSLDTACGQGLARYQQCLRSACLPQLFRTSVSRRPTLGAGTVGEGGEEMKRLAEILGF